MKEECVRECVCCWCLYKFVFILSLLGVNNQSIILVSALFGLGGWVSFRLKSICFQIHSYRIVPGCTYFILFSSLLFLTLVCFCMLASCYRLWHIIWRGHLKQKLSFRGYSSIVEIVNLVIWTKSVNVIMWNLKFFVLFVEFNIYFDKLSGRESN